MLADETEENQRLRVYVTGGGCSGFQYGFTFDSNLADDDTLIIKDGAPVVVDSLSYQYLVGAEIDYEEGLEVFSLSGKKPECQVYLWLWFFVLDMKGWSEEFCGTFFEPQRSRKAQRKRKTLFCVLRDLCGLQAL